MSVNRTIWCLALLVGVAMGGCATTEQFDPLSSVPSEPASAEVMIHPRDTLVVVVQNQPTSSGEFAVRSDGGVNLPTVGEVSAAGRTLGQVAADLRPRYAAVFTNASVNIEVTPAPIRVNVVGEVKTPASYELTRDRSVTAALAAAGWLTEFADRDRILVVRRNPHKRFRFSVHDITRPDDAVAQFRLLDGDVIVVE
jgi:polysaccharide export outer membrane protein